LDALRRSAIPADPGALADLGWLGGAVCLLWFSLGWIAAARSVRRSRPAPPSWQLEVNALCERWRMTREVRLGLIEGVTSPLAVGLRRSTILLPDVATTWSAERRRAVLLHELAHVRRGDCPTQLVTQAACALYWFNPLVWLAAARLRAERERACDDEVLRTGTRPSEYAAHLLDIAKHLRPALRPSAALAMARPSLLEGRLLAVLSDRGARIPARATRWVIAVIMATTTAAVLGATAMPPEQPAPDSPPRVIRHPNATMAVSPGAADDASAAVEALHRALSDSDQDVREKATMALAFMSGVDVVPALLTALNDANSQVREKAAIGLALRRDERVIEPLLEAMKDPDSQVREKAAIALGSSGDARAASALTAALNDPDSQVREKAAAGLTLLALAR
jgi:hypothetical protein